MKHKDNDLILNKEDIEDIIFELNEVKDMLDYDDELIKIRISRLINTYFESIDNF